MLRTNGGTFNGNANGREALSQQTMDMFQAIKNDKLGRVRVRQPERPVHPQVTRGESRANRPVDPPPAVA